MLVSTQAASFRGVGTTAPPETRPCGPTPGRPTHWRPAPGTARPRGSNTAQDKISAGLPWVYLANGSVPIAGAAPKIFAEADEEQRAMPHLWAVHDAQAGTLVGFAMISDNIPPPIDDDLVGPYYLWKLLIDHRCQRRGYGAATLDAVVTTRGRGPALRCSTPAARTALARRAGLPPPRLHRHRPGHVGRERPRARPRAAGLTGGSPRSPTGAGTCRTFRYARAMS